MSIFNKKLLEEMPTLANPSSDEESDKDDEDFVENFRVKSKFYYTYSIESASPTIPLR